MRRTALGIAATAIVTVVAGVLHYATNSDVATFIVSAIALSGLAWLVGVGTESVGVRFGPAATGVLQSTLGNLPELFIVLFALGAGEVVVAQTSILGSFFANALLVLGLAVVAGCRACDNGVMTFSARLPNDTAILTLLASFLIVLLGISDRIGDRASGHVLAVSIAGAVVLLVVYAVWVVDYLRTEGAREASLEESPHHLPFGPAVVLLAGAGVAAAFVSDWFVSALDPAVEALGISKAFTGLVIVGIAGNAVENVVGVTLAAKGQFDLAVSVIKNSVAQVIAFLYPALVLLSLFFDTRLTFVINPVLTSAIALAAISVWAITGDGRATTFEGVALVGFYVILAALVWYE